MIIWGDILDSTENRLAESLLADDKKIILTYLIKYPQFEGASDKINIFYDEMAHDFESYIKNELYHLIKNEYDTCQDRGKRLHFTALSVFAEYTVKRCDEDIISLIYDISRFKGGKLIDYYVFPNSWDSRRGFLLSGKNAGCMKDSDNYYIIGSETISYTFKAEIPEGGLKIRRSELSKLREITGKQKLRYNYFNI